MNLAQAQFCQQVHIFRAHLSRAMVTEIGMQKVFASIASRFHLQTNINDTVV